MKKGTIAAITTAILLIAGLMILAGYLTVRWQRDPMASQEESMQVEADAVLQELSELQNGTEPQDGNESPDKIATESSDSQTEEDTAAPAEYADANPDGTTLTDHVTGAENESETEPDTEWVLELLAIEDTPVIWVGDSRTVGMQKALGSYSDDVFIGAAGEGYSWLSETGIPFLKSAISDYPTRPVIFNMGVNDYENLYNYMVLYAEVTAEYADTVFYFLSVNPVDDEAELYVTNADIEDFNTRLKTTYPDTYLDSYNFLLESGTETIDGIHYSEEAYRQIYLFVKDALSLFSIS
ncbi:MAG: hypothetical protein LUD16_06725 [Lachnospiraceae bacterium]|nr:hypothetical protein [Lachnospiraceae bacterium]